MGIGSDLLRAQNPLYLWVGKRTTPRTFLGEEQGNRLSAWPTVVLRVP